MKNIKVSEIMSREESSILSEEITLKTYLNLKKEETQNYYILNNGNILTGIINEQAVLQFISPMLFLLDQEKGNHLMKEIEDVPVYSVANKSFQALNLDDNLSDLLITFAQTTENTLPVVDKEGHLAGSVSIQSLLDRISINAELFDLFKEKIPQAI